MTSDPDIEAYLFDLDHTLCEYNRTTPEVLEIAFERAEIEPFFEAQDYYDRFTKFVEESENIVEMRKKCFADIALEKGRERELGVEVAREFAEERDHTNVRFVEGAREVLETVSSEGIGIGVVTNGGRWMQSQKIESLGIDEVVDVAVFAGEETRWKPEPEPFEKALNYLGSSPEETVMVGDSIEADVEGANDLGMKTVWISNGYNPGEYSPDYVIESTQDLLETWISPFSRRN